MSVCEWAGQACCLPGCSSIIMLFMFCSPGYLRCSSQSGGSVGAPGGTLCMRAPCPATDPPHPGGNILQKIKRKNICFSEEKVKQVLSIQVPHVLICLLKLKLPFRYFQLNKQIFSRIYCKIFPPPPPPVNPVLITLSSRLRWLVAQGGLHQTEAHTSHILLFPCLLF